MRFDLDAQVMMLLVDYRLELALEGGRELTLEQPAVAILPDGATLTISAADRAAGMLHFISRFGRVVQSVEYSESGVLDIYFDDGAKWQVEPNDDYESWEFRDHESSTRVLCQPGGEIATWGLASDPSNDRA